jgi:four helix bundle protein
MNNEHRIMNNGKIYSFTDLNAWKEAHELVLLLYKTTKNFPKSEAYSLVDQIRRAGVSIVSNIAEGFSRESYREKIQFYAISRGSVTEIQSQLLISRDLSYLPRNEFNSLSEKSVIVHKLLSGLIKSSKLKVTQK